MKHILFIDPLEKLTVKKDSTIMLALALKEKGESVYILFEEDFYYQNKIEQKFSLYDFTGSFGPDEITIKDFELTKSSLHLFDSGDIFHMRLDPPFDGRYLRYLWILKSFKARGLKVINDPEGIMLFNEKLYALEQEESVTSYIGSSIKAFENFIQELKTNNVVDLIFKPLDLYQGIGVKKYSIEDVKLTGIFEKTIEEYAGPVVVQPFIKEVEMGEVRSLYYDGVELGSILKVPAKGDYLANIAAGATYEAHSIDSHTQKICEKICKEMTSYGVPWLAFDILGGNISEVNITCPGLLVEVSKAHNTNLSKKIVDLI